MLMWSLSLPLAFAHLAGRGCHRSFANASAVLGKRVAVGLGEGREGHATPRHYPPHDGLSWGGIAAVVAWGSLGQGSGQAVVWSGGGVWS